MKVFVNNYNDESLVEITIQQMLEMIISFDREQIVHDDHTRLEYYTINTQDPISEQVINLFKHHHVIVIHQDSENDIYLVM